jgi:hypothetical protein
VPHLGHAATYAAAAHAAAATAHAPFIAAHAAAAPALRGGEAGDQYCR